MSAFTGAFLMVLVAVAGAGLLIWLVRKAEPYSDNARRARERVVSVLHPEPDPNADFVPDTRGSGPLLGDRFDFSGGAVLSDPGGHDGDHSGGDAGGDGGGGDGGAH